MKIDEKLVNSLNWMIVYFFLITVNSLNWMIVYFFLITFHPKGEPETPIFCVTCPPSRALRRGGRVKAEASA
jgi:hypothetical protein